MVYENRYTFLPNYMTDHTDYWDFFCLSKQLLKRLFSKSASRKLSELTFTFREIFLIGVLKCLYKCLFKRYIWEVFLRCLISFTREFVIFEWVLLIEFIVHYSTLKKKVDRGKKWQNIAPMRYWWETVSGVDRLSADERRAICRRHAVTRTAQMNP